MRPEPNGFRYLTDTRTHIPGARETLRPVYLAELLLSPAFWPAFVLLSLSGTLYTMGAGKCGQLGVGRAVETSSEPKVVTMASGTTVKKVRSWASTIRVITGARRATNTKNLCVYKLCVYEQSARTLHRLLACRRFVVCGTWCATCHGWFCTRVSAT